MNEEIKNKTIKEVKEMTEIYREEHPEVKLPEKLLDEYVEYKRKRDSIK